jgi:alanyl-tRNA synthetase
MATTVKLYNADPYLKEFDAKVIEINGINVILDQTAFYPEGGGQAGDTGFLNDNRVLDTKTIDSSIIHILEETPSFQMGDTIRGLIDWERRHNIMKLHTASHMMEYYLWKHFGYAERTGSNVDDRKDRADYAYDERLDPETLKKVEEDANRFLLEGHDVIIIEDEHGMRNWKCGPVEMHCSGTHVKNTIEVGKIKLKRKNPGRGEERVETSLA